MNAILAACKPILQISAVKQKQANNLFEKTLSPSLQENRHTVPICFSEIVEQRFEPNSGSPSG